MTIDTPSAHPVFGKSHLPLYAQCANLLRQRIVDDVWSVGNKLPTVDFLMAELSVSRITIRQAISMLSNEGLVKARRGLGTSVIHQPEKTRPLNLSYSFTELVNVYRGDTPLLTNMTETSDAPKIDESEGKLLPAYTHIQRVHKRGDDKYCVISLYIDETLFLQAPDRFRTELALPVLTSLDSFKFSRSWQTLRISNASIETANLIGISVGDPTAEVRRIFQSADGSILYLANITYRGDYIELKMELTQ